jgi:Fe-S-cluster containining protein
MAKTSDILGKLSQMASSAKVENQKLLKQLKRKPSSEVDGMFQLLHEEVFKEIDCLECANCCSTISPIITDRDIDKISRTLRIKPSEVVETYLLMDDENDWVFRKHPCPFLGTDKYCSIYENRPKACREYPHTDRRKIQQLFNLTLKNSKVCPAVYLILERLRKTT